jgi:hypothetical protein
MTIEINQTPINWPSRCVNCWREATVSMKVASSYVLVPPIVGVPFCDACAAAPQGVRRRIILSVAIMFSGLLIAAMALLALAAHRDQHVALILAIDASMVLWCTMVVLLTWLALRHEAHTLGRVSLLTPIKIVRNQQPAVRIVLNVKRREVVEYLLEHNEARPSRVFVL